MENSTVNANDPRCIFCGATLIWQSSINADELIDDAAEDDMIHYYVCSKCGSTYEIFQPICAPSKECS